MSDGIFFKTLGKYAGIGGIAVGAVIVIFSTFLRRNIFPTFSTDQAYNILKLLLLLTFTIGVIGIAGWLHAKHANLLLIVFVFLFAAGMAYMGNQRLDFVADQEKQKTNPYPVPEPVSSPTPSPTVSPTPTALSPAPTPVSRPSTSALQVQPEVISIDVDDTKTALDGKVSVSLIGISFEGNPLHHRASFRVRTPVGIRTYEKRDVGQIVTFPGYEIRLSKVDTFHAEFDVSQISIRHTAHP